MDNKKKEVMDIVTKIFSDEASAEALMKAEAVEEIENIMESKDMSFTRRDCEFLLVIKDKNFVQSLTEMKNNEEVQAVLEEKGFTLSLDECAIFRIMANKSIMESLVKVKSTEEVRNILDENGITLTPEAYSNLEWNLEVDVELSEDELSDVAGGGWFDGWQITAVAGAVGIVVGLFVAAAGVAAVGVPILAVSAVALIVGVVKSVDTTNINFGLFK